METQTEIDEYATLFGSIRERVGDSDVALAILHELSKDRRMAQIVQERNGNGQSNGEFATPKQLGYIRKLGGKTRKGMTKAEASAMIDELAGQNGY